MVQSNNNDLSMELHLIVCATIRRIIINATTGHSFSHLTIGEGEDRIEISLVGKIITKEETIMEEGVMIGEEEEEEGGEEEVMVDVENRVAVEEEVEDDRTT